MINCLFFFRTYISYIKKERRKSKIKSNLIIVNYYRNRNREKNNKKLYISNNLSREVLIKESLAISSEII